MISKIKTYSAFMSDKFKIVTNYVLPCLAILIALAGYTHPLFSFFSLMIFIYIEIFQDYWGLNGITQKDFSGFTYLKSGPNGMKHVMDAFYGDMIIRAIRNLVEVAISYLPQLIKGEGIKEAIIVYLSLFALATLGICVSRCFNTVFAQSLCASFFAGMGAGLMVKVLAIGELVEGVEVKINLTPYLILGAVLTVIALVVSISFTRSRLSRLFEMNKVF